MSKIQFKNAKSKFISVYSTLKLDEVAFIRSLLDAAKIQYYVTNEMLSYRTAAVAQFMDIMVVQDSANKAKELLKEFISPKNKNKD